MHIVYKRQFISRTNEPHKSDGQAVIYLHPALIRSVKDNPQKKTKKKKKYPDGIIRSIQS